MSETAAAAGEAIPVASLPLGVRAAYVEGYFADGLGIDAAAQNGLREAFLTDSTEKES